MTASSASFLIVTWPGGGNLPPALALGRRLVAAGHRTSVTGPDPLAGAVRAAGLRFRPCPAVAPWPDGVAFEEDPVRFDAIRNAPSWPRICSRSLTPRRLLRWLSIA